MPGALNSHFLLLDAQVRLMTLLKKKVKFSSKSNPGERCSREGENLQVLYIMNLVSLVAFENVE